MSHLVRDQHTHRMIHLSESIQSTLARMSLILNTNRESITTIFDAFDNAVHHVLSNIVIILEANNYIQVPCNQFIWLYHKKYRLLLHLKKYLLRYIRRIVSRRLNNFFDLYCTTFNVT